MKRALARLAAVAALVLLAACVSSGTTTVDPSIDARTLDLSGTWKVKARYYQTNNIWIGHIDLVRDGDEYTGTMRWARGSRVVEQSVRCTASKDSITLKGQEILRKTDPGTYYPDTLHLAPTSPVLLVGRAGDTGANGGTAKIWRE